MTCIDDDAQVATCVIDPITSSLCFSRSSNVIDKPQLLYKKPDSNLFNALVDCIKRYDRSYKPQNVRDGPGVATLRIKAFDLECMMNLQNMRKWQAYWTTDPVNHKKRSVFTLKLHANYKSINSEVV